MGHGELTTVVVDHADGPWSLQCVVVEVKRVPKNRRRKIVNRFNGTGYGVMRPADYILCYGVQPWEGSRARAGRTETVH
jgi:hypothetical protein